MKKEQNFKLLFAGVLLRLTGIILIGIFLVAVNTVLVRGGQIPIDMNINFVTHFLAITAIGLASRLLVKEGNAMLTIISVSFLYVLMLFIDVVVLDGIHSDFIYSVIGGAAGVLSIILMSISHKKKRPKLKTKKYSC